MYKKCKRRREKEENGSRDKMVVGQPSTMGRYPSTGFQVRALLEYVDVQGSVLDCCGASQDAVSTVLTARGLRVAIGTKHNGHDHMRHPPRTTHPCRGMVGRVTKAHMASTRQDLSERQLLGEDRLYEDFVAQSCCTLGRHAGSTARRERHRRPPGHRDWQTREHRVQVHEKGEGVGQAFQRWIQHHQRHGIFQESFWYSMLQLMTGPRRIASGLLTIAKSDYGNPKIMPFMSPVRTTISS